LRSKAVIVILVGAGIVLSLPLLKQTAARMIADIPTVYAACATTKEAPLGGTDCPDSRLNDSLDITAVGPGGKKLSNGDAVYRGETITLSLSYNVKTSSGSDWDAWMDMNNFDPNACSNYSSAAAWGSGCLSGATTGHGGVDYQDLWGGVGDNYEEIEQGDNCPSFFYNSDSPFYDGSDLAAPSPENQDYTYAGAEFPWAGAYGVAPGDPGHSTCGTQGMAMAWHGVDMQAGDTPKYSVNLKFNPDYSGSNGQICINGDISKNNVNGTLIDGDHSTNGGDLYYVTSGANTLCLTINVPVTVSGNVQSDPITGTGQRFDSQSNIVAVSADCKYDDINSGDGGGYVSTDANGSFYIPWFQGEPFCAAPNTEGASPVSPYSWAYNGTQFVNVRAPNYYPASPGDGEGNDPPSWTSYNTAQVCPISCSGYNFYWIPAGIAPIATKSLDAGIFSGGGANYGPGASLKPGDQDDFYITSTNSYDSNNPAAALTDDIPLNIDPSTVVVDSVTLVQDGGPPGWDVIKTALPTGPIWLLPSELAVYGYYESGYTGELGTIDYNVSYGSGSTRPSITFNLNDMPAYSQLQVHWHGDVWGSASQIGVYPGYANNGDTRYCANEASVNYGSPSSILANCQDFANGYEGVSNFATAAAGCQVDSSCPTVGTVSGITYRPIPPPPPTGCIAKNYTSGDAFDGNDSSIIGVTATYSQVPSCPNDITTVNPPVSYVYSDPEADDSTDYDTGTFSTEATFPVSSVPAGPNYYSIDDQNGGGDLDPAMTASDCSTANSDIGAPVGCSGTGLPSGAQHLTWANLANIGGGNSSEVSFNATWNNPDVHPIGDSACNTSQLTIYDYSVSPHAAYPSASNTVCVKHVNVVRPNIQVTGNDVDAGASTNTGCTPPANPSTAFGTINTNNSTGQYVVSASGAITDLLGDLTNVRGFGSNTGNSGTGSSSGTLTQDNYGLTCLPNVTQQVQTDLTKSGGGTPINPGAIDDSGNDGKIMVGNVPAGGTFQFGAGGTTTISKRWTLYVNGNVYIDSNIAFGPTGSLAIVATGTISIDPSVTQADAFMYADTINTCEDGSGNTLGAPWSGLTCNNQLTVNGLLFARHFRFNRTSTSSTSPSEVINFSPQLYLYTPPGLSDIGLNEIDPNYELGSPRY